MQAEWEELARRNWLEESDDQGPIQPTVSPAEKVSSEPVVTFDPIQTSHISVLAHLC